MNNETEVLIDINENNVLTANGKEIYVFLPNSKSREVIPFDSEWPSYIRSWMQKWIPLRGTMSTKINFNFEPRKNTNGIENIFHLENFSIKHEYLDLLKQYIVIVIEYTNIFSGIPKYFEHIVPLFTYTPDPSDPSDGIVPGLWVKLRFQEEKVEEGKATSRSYTAKRHRIKKGKNKPATVALSTSDNLEVKIDPLPT